MDLQQSTAGISQQLHDGQGSDSAGQADLLGSLRACALAPAFLVCRGAPLKLKPLDVEATRADILRSAAVDVSASILLH